LTTNCGCKDGSGEEVAREPMGVFSVPGKQT